MHAFWLVLTYDLLEDRRIDDVIVKTFFNSLLYKTNRFQVAVRLYNFFVLTTFWRHLWSITDQTHGNLESFCLLENLSKLTLQNTRLAPLPLKAPKNILASKS